MLNGTATDDLILGLAGADVLNGLAGNDILVGGPGSNTVTVGDTFGNGNGYGGNSGSQNFVNNWTELNDTGGNNGGPAKGKSVLRTIHLSSATATVPTMASTQPRSNAR